MSDVEWYVESSGIRTGPFSAREIVQKHLEGQIPGNAMATAARMQGDWVSISDLVEAFKELNPAKRAAAPFSPLAPSSNGDGPSFQAPPRPVEQLETSKIINLKQLREGDGPKDATESLFLAVQAIREKSALKNAQAAASQKDAWGELKRPAQKVPARTSMLGALVLLLMVTAWGVTRLIDDEKKAPEVAESQTEKNTNPSSANRPSGMGASGGNGLLQSSGNGAGVRGATPPPMNSGGGAVRLDNRRQMPGAMPGRPGNFPTNGDAARAEDGEEIDQTEPESFENEGDGATAGRGNKAGMPMDPSRMNGSPGNEGENYAPVDENGRIAEPMHDNAEGVAPDGGSP